jgi:hypothetical protein
MHCTGDNQTFLNLLIHDWRLMMFVIFGEKFLFEHLLVQKKYSGLFKGNTFMRNTRHSHRTNAACIIILIWLLNLAR